jgi:hypothetical protein
VPLVTVGVKPHAGTTEIAVDESHIGLVGVGGAPEVGDHRRVEGGGIGHRSTREVPERRREGGDGPAVTIVDRS